MVESTRIMVTKKEAKASFFAIKNQIELRLLPLCRIIITTIRIKIGG